MSYEDLSAMAEDSCPVNECDSSRLCVYTGMKQWLDLAHPVLMLSASLSNSLFSLQLCCHSLRKHESFLGNSDVKQFKCMTHLNLLFPVSVF